MAQATSKLCEVRLNKPCVSEGENGGGKGRKRGETEWEMIN